MSANPVAVWRSSAPEVLAAWQQWREARATWGERVTEHSRSVAGEPAVTRRWSNTESYVGPGIGEQEEAPHGWRIEPPLDVHYEGGVRYLLPNKRTKAGKENAQAVAELGETKSLTLPGMPFHFFGGNHIYSPSVYADADQATNLTLCWATEEVAAEIDEAVWSRVLLSQWHAEQEAKAVAS